ncbi:MAG TPA: MarR family winged helix-turn-helix transcriptional regulator [Jiangellaceae bacterium]|jgi:DNA-binding MarR family transcriptional regulator|nr:MarR family winged helix-turn-helix transcriptional regulator [Jiangellaceae bacterium]
MSPVKTSPFGIGTGSELALPVRAFRTVLVLAQRLRYLMDERMRADGLTTQQAALLTVVIALGRPSLTEAAAALGTTHQNVAQLVSALERKDFLRVEPDPADRRRRLLVTTEANDTYWRSRDESDLDAVREWFSALSTAEIATLCELADRLLAHLDASSRASERGGPG